MTGDRPSWVEFNDAPQGTTKPADLWALALGALMPAGWMLWQLGVVAGERVASAILGS